uniref:Reverse transcriptase Ty1/copia-type domain-containing protein n=1 Tax=Cannabis sativa TaxID=3483 RepID=A0A803PJQ8_CANSA
MNRTARFELEKFNGTGDFGLWRESLKGILIHQKVSKDLKPKEELTEKLKKEKLEDMEELAYYTIIMYLSNIIRRKVQNIKTAPELWRKLEEIYMTPSLTNKINLLESLYGFKIFSHLSLDDNLDAFNQIIIGLANMNYAVDEESQDVILLQSLPAAYQELNAVIKYGRDILTLDDVLGALKSKEQEMAKEKHKEVGQENQSDLTNYQLAGDTTRREIKTPSRYVEANLIAYALAVVQLESDPEPTTYEEVITRAPKVVYLLLYVKDMMIINKDKTEIQIIKDKLSSKFKMKDLGVVKKMLANEVIRKRQEGKLMLSQKSYIKKVIKKFNLELSKTTSLPLAGRFKLSNEQCPKTETKRERMKGIPYAMAVGCLSISWQVPDLI